MQTSSAALRAAKWPDHLGKSSSNDRGQVIAATASDIGREMLREATIWRSFDLSTCKELLLLEEGPAPLRLYKSSNRLFQTKQLLVERRYLYSSGASQSMHHPATLSGVASSEGAQFLPSDELTRYVLRGMKALHEESKAFDAIAGESTESGQDSNGAKSSNVTPTLEGARKLLAAKVKLFLSVIGTGLQRLGRYRRMPITKDRRFIDSIVGALLAEVPLDKYELPQFLDHLYRELREIARLQSYGGNWGYLMSGNDGELFLEIRAVEPVRSQDLEWVPARVRKLKLGKT